MENAASRTVAAGPAAIDRRPVAAGDEAFLLAVYASTRAEEMALVAWSDAEKTAFLESQMWAQKREYEARYPNATHEIVLLDEQPIGQIWIGRSREEVRLLDIALLPPYRGHGVGTVLLGELQSEAARLGIPLRHCVYKPNRLALAFYARLGFVVTGDLGMYLQMEWTASKGVRGTVGS